MTPQEFESFRDMRVRLLRTDSVETFKKMNPHASTYDELLPTNVVEVIMAMDKEKQGDRCEYLLRQGKYFYYCGAEVHGFDRSFSINSPVLYAYVSPIEQQNYCRGNGCKKCVFFNEASRDMHNKIFDALKTLKEKLDIEPSQ